MDSKRSASADEASAMAILKAAHAGGRGRRSPMNRLREDILEILWREQRPLSAYDLLAELERKHGRRLGPPVVYRGLDFLLCHHLAVRIRIRNAYMRNPSPGRRRDPAFLLCDHCGHADAIDNPDLERLIAEDAGRRGFEIRQPVIEFRGLCSDCRMPEAGASGDA